MILRGSGASTAALARLAADNGVRTLAHAEGGGVLYVHGSARADRVTAIVDSSLDRLGVCNRLNLALVDREAAGLAADARRRVRAAWRRASSGPPARPPSCRSVSWRSAIGYEWASDPARVATVTLDLVDDLDEAVRIANTETSALAAGIVAEDADAVERFFSLYRGTAAFWHASTRFTDGFELTGTPETGINVEWAPGPRGPVTLPRPVAAAVPRRRRRHATSMRIVVKLGSSLVATPKGAVRRGLLAARAKEVADAARGRPLRLHRLLRCDRARRAPARLRAEAVGDAPAPGRVGRRPGAAPAGLGAGARARRPPGGADPALARRRRRPADLRQRLQHLRRAVPARGGPGRERERRDGDRRDHLRRQRLPGGAGRRPDERPAARPAHRGRRRLLARPGNAGGGAARRRLAHVRRPARAAAPVSAAAAWEARSRPRSSPPAPAFRP